MQQPRLNYTEAKLLANRAKVVSGGVAVAIHRAAERGDAANLLDLVEPWFAHPVLNDYSVGGTWTPLIRASVNGHIECVRVLVAQPVVDLNKGVLTSKRQPCTLLHLMVMSTPWNCCAPCQASTATRRIQMAIHLIVMHALVILASTKRIGRGRLGQSSRLKALCLSQC